MSEASLDPKVSSSDVVSSSAAIQETASTIISSSAVTALSVPTVTITETVEPEPMHVAEPAPYSPPKPLGWRPDMPDQRDFFYAAPARVMTSLPTAIDLRPQCPPVYDQGQIGSCTGNSIAAAIQFDRMKMGLTPAFTPSRLFIYYNERVIEHTVRSDAGAMIRDGIKAVSKQGVCPEDHGVVGSWPYDGSDFPGVGGHDEKKPPAVSYAYAAKHKVVAYHRVVQNVSQLKGCLAEGYPIVFGFVCYNSLFDDDVTETGNIKMPKSNEATIGGHAILMVGYDDARQVFLIRNSWGTSWGDKGYGTMPYAYITDPNLSSDFWTVRGVTA